MNKYNTQKVICIIVKVYKDKDRIKKEENVIVYSSSLFFLTMAFSTAETKVEVGC